MAATAPKQALMKGKGYLFHDKFRFFYNREAKKIFSDDVVDDTPETQLQQMINEDNNTGSWRFYCNRPLSEEKREEILSEIGETT